MALADSLACWILREHYENFRAAYPGITLKMATASTEELFRMLNQNETDLVYTLDHHVYNSDYIIGAEERIQAHFVAAPGFLPFSSLTCTGPGTDHLSISPDRKGDELPPSDGRASGPVLPGGTPGSGIWQCRSFMYPCDSGRRSVIFA